MKKILVFSICIVYLYVIQLNLHSQISNSENENQIIIGRLDSLHSTILNETRKIWIYVPESAKESNFAPTNYPVLYLLDGETYFHSVTGLVKFLSYENNNTLCPEMIVVGVINTDRIRDLTPTRFIEYASDSTSGGGAKFISFIEGELIPYIDENYPSTNFRTLIGHSLGGLSAIQVLLNKPNIFNNYIAIDPSMQWDNQVLVHQGDSILRSVRFDKQSLYIGLANNSMIEDIELEEIRNDSIPTTVILRSTLQFLSSIETNARNGLKYEWKYYSKDDHQSVVLIAAYDALRYLFNFHKLNSNDLYAMLFSEESTPEDQLNYITAHYNKVSEHLGYQVYAPERLVDAIAHALLDYGMQEVAFAYFQLNTRNYEASAHAFESLGDYYVSQSSFTEASECYGKAIELGSISAKAKLEQFE